MYKASIYLLHSRVSLLQSVYFKSLKLRPNMQNLIKIGMPKKNRSHNNFCHLNNNNNSQHNSSIISNSIDTKLNSIDL
jgi:hypothetical protein